MALPWRRLPYLGSAESRLSLLYGLNWHPMNYRQNMKRAMGKAIQQFHYELDAESLQQYPKGGYHPTHLGATLKDGRYKVTHKLGWGGYAAVWLATDMK